MELNVIFNGLIVVKIRRILMESKVDRQKVAPRWVEVASDLAVGVATEPLQSATQHPVVVQPVAQQAITARGLLGVYSKLAYFATPSVWLVKKYHFPRIISSFI